MKCEVAQLMEKTSSLPKLSTGALPVLRRRAQAFPQGGEENTIVAGTHAHAWFFVNIDSRLED